MVLALYTKGQSGRIGGSEHFVKISLSLSKIMRLKREFSPCWLPCQIVDTHLQSFQWYMEGVYWSIYWVRSKWVVMYPLNKPSFQQVLGYTHTLCRLNGNSYPIQPSQTQNFNPCVIICSLETKTTQGPWLKLHDLSLPGHLALPWKMSNAWNVTISLVILQPSKMNLSWFFFHTYKMPGRTRSSPWVIADLHIWPHIRRTMAHM